MSQIKTEPSDTDGNLLTGYMFLAADEWLQTARSGLSGTEKLPQRHSVSSYIYRTLIMDKPTLNVCMHSNRWL